MNKKLKKFMSLLLAAIFIVSTMFSAFAETEVFEAAGAEEVIAAEAVEAIETEDIQDPLFESLRKRDGLLYNSDDSSVVEFSCNGLCFILADDRTAKLSDILNVLGLSGDVSLASSSNPSLLIIEKVQGDTDWTVEVSDGFTSSEKLIVTIDQIQHEIEVSLVVISVPRVIVNTKNKDGNSITKSTGYVNTSIEIINVDGTKISDTNGKIKVRGNSTSGGKKKPFNIKFEKKQNVLEMGEAKKWCLLANCFDPTLMRNYIGIELARRLKLDYTSSQAYVELWVDGLYKGCYLLMEAVEKGKNRVNIDTDNGDFLVELNSDRTEDGVTYVIAKDGVRFEVSEPEEPDEGQLSGIQDALNKVADSINSGEYNRVASTIDIDSFSKMYLLNEFMKTVDFGGMSVYYYYKDNKLYCGPAWDFDLSSGNADVDYYSSYYSYDSDDLTGYKGLWASRNLWVNKLRKYPEFCEYIYGLFQEKSEIFKNVFLSGGMIDTLTENYQDIYEKNYSLAGWNVSERYSGLEREPLPTFEQNVEFLREWFYNRYEYLLKALNPDRPMCTVIWRNDDGEVLKKSQVEYGIVPEYKETPTKQADAQYTYTFAGWDKTLTAVTGDATYTATYDSTVNEYAVTIGVNESGYGTVTSSSETAAYGTSVSASGAELTIGSRTITAAPTAAGEQYTYSFKEWTGIPEDGKITGATTITAVFERTVNKYTVTWKNWDNSVLYGPTEVEYGSVPSYGGPAPSRPNTISGDSTIQYVFKGWDRSIVAVIETTTYIAVYEPVVSKNSQPADKSAVDETKLLDGLDVSDGTTITLTIESEIIEEPQINENGKVVKVVYDIKPVAVVNDGESSQEVPVKNEVITKAMSVKIPIPENVSGEYVQIKHIHEDGSEEITKAKIQGSGKNRFVQIHVNSFSTFELEFVDTFYTIDNIPSYTETGSSIRPAVVVRDGSTVVSSTEYTVSYRNNVNPGIATAIVTFIATGDTISSDFTITKKRSDGGNGGHSDYSGGGGSSSGGGAAGGPSAKKVAAGTPTFSKNWVADAAGVWRIKDKAGNYVTSAWLCDDAVTTNGQNVWYLMNTDGTMLAAGLVQDNTGNYYSLEMNHNGYYGMLRYKNGTYDGIYMEFSQKHDGTFGAITNQSAIDALKAKYGVTKFGIGNDRCVYTKTFE